MSDASFAHCHKCWQPKYACDCDAPGTLDAAVRAIDLLVGARDELELPMRAPGELVIVTRQSLDSILNNLAIVSRLIRKTAER